MANNRFNQAANQQTNTTVENGVTRRRFLARGTAFTVAAAAAAGSGLTVLSGSALAHAGTQAGGAAMAGQPAKGSSGTYQIARELGAGSINQTDVRWGLYGADLGHMFTHKGKIYMTFGDSFGGPAADPFFSQPHSDWRSNTMAYIKPSAAPSHGLFFEGMITDKPGHAKELLSSKKITGDEQTVIPTYGVSTGHRMFLHYMSVREFDQPGHWALNYSGLAHSDDDGQNWTKDMNATWPGNSNFGQVAIVEQGDWLHFFGIPGGRYGGVQLARVRSKTILDLATYQYWNGKSWQTNDPSHAVSIVPAPVGELSVRWNSYYKKWLMMYLNDPQGLIILRTADQLTGPWDNGRVVVTAQQYPALYAPFITPMWNNGPDIYFTMSLFGPYSVYLLHTTLQE